MAYSDVRSGPRFMSLIYSAGAASGKCLFGKVPGVGKQGPQQGIVGGVAGFSPFEAGDHGSACQRQVTDGIQNLVADAILGKALRPAIEAPLNVPRPGIFPGLPLEPNHTLPAL